MQIPTMHIVLWILLCFAHGFNAQKIELESTLLRCNPEEMVEDGTPKNPLKLASSSGTPKLDLKLYSTCRKKLIITLRVTETAEEFVPSALIVIDRAKNTLTQKSSRFGFPLAVKFIQEKMYQKYALKYLYRVNGKMWEEVINIENHKGYSGCKNGSVCGVVNSGGVQRNAGFCCSCHDHKSNVQQRSGHRCDYPGKSEAQLTSAHCLRSSLHWYNVYEIFPPHIYQQLNFEVFKSKGLANGSLSWERMSASRTGVDISSEDHIKYDGIMKVTYLPHVEGISHDALLFNAASQRLLFPVPNIFADDKGLSEPEALKGSLEDQILIVPKTKMSPHGALCDHVGTKLEAFVNQEEACRKERNSCLGNQPFDLWKQDQGPNGDPDKRYRLASYQAEKLMDFSEDYRTGAVYVGHPAGAPTYVDIEIPADDLVILAPGYNAFIESVLTDTSLDGSKIVAQVMNKELVAAAFSIELVQCSLNFSRSPDETSSMEIISEKANIGPLGSHWFHLDIHSSEINQPVTCYLVLVNEFGESIAAREVKLNPAESCLCVHTCQCACGEGGNTHCEKMSEASIIAAGMMFTIKLQTPEHSEPGPSFFERHEKYIHWILIFHFVILICAICGWMQKQCRNGENEKLKGGPKHNVESNPSSSESEVTEHESIENIPTQRRRQSKKSAKIIPTDRQPPESLAVSNMSTRESSRADLAVSSAEESVEPQIQRDEQSRENQTRPNFNPPKSVSSKSSKQPPPTKSPAPSSKQPPAKSPKYLYHLVEVPWKKKVTFSSSTDSNALITVDCEDSDMFDSDNEEGQRDCMNNIGNVDQFNSNLVDLNSPRANYNNQNANYYDAKEDDYRTHKMIEKSNSSNAPKQQDGPLAAGSAEIWTGDHNTEDIDVADSFLIPYSTSSSETSMGTLNRRRRDQFSAYDFLPEPKVKSSLS